MIFLQPIYQYLLSHYAMRINHFALIKLILFAVDKTLFYFLIFIFVRLLYFLLNKRKRNLKKEALLWLFTFYLLLLLMLTTFRDTYFPWQLVFSWKRPLSDINLIFMKETFKLVDAPSKLDFFYNSFGNIVWFVPFGFLFPFFCDKTRHFWSTLFLGFLLSLAIETLQFFLRTGVSDIDDVFFNTLGTGLGYMLYSTLVKEITSLRRKKLLK